jgi:hypothetical protein
MIELACVGKGRYLPHLEMLGLCKNYAYAGPSWLVMPPVDSSRLGSFSLVRQYCEGAL